MIKDVPFTIDLLNTSMIVSPHDLYPVLILFFYYAGVIGQYSCITILTIRFFTYGIA